MSIRTRVIVWFVALTALLLVAFSGTVYGVTHAARVTALDESLGARAAALAALVERDHGEFEAEFAEELIPSRDLLGGMAGYEVRTHPDDELLARSDGWQDAVPGAVTLDPVFDEPWSPPEELPHELIHATWSAPVAGADARLYRGKFVVREDGVAADGGPAIVTITVAEELGAVRQDLSALLATLAGVGLGMLLLSVLAGWVLSRRIVDPLAHIAATAEGIQAAGAARTVPVGGSGDEIDRLATTLNATFARLLDAYERQARFTADASHELRTPVSIIRTQAEVALRKTRTPGEYQEALDAIVEGSERMGDTLEGLLLLARADAGATEPLRERVDLRAPAEAAIAEESEAAGERSLALRMDSPAAVEVSGDARQLQVVIRNLLSNAVRHSEGPGEVTVRLRADDGHALIEVEDPGEGIPAEQIDRIFERFYRVDKARSRARGGAGLGLSIVQVIATGHGGSVEAESVVGEGTVVRVRLPRG